MLKNKAQIDLEWSFIKIPFAVFWVIFALNSLYSSNAIAIDKGVCNLFNCNYLIGGLIKFMISAAVISFAALYCLEIRMKVSTAMLGLLSLLIFSIEESFGVSSRTGIFTLIFFAQFFAYAIKAVSEGESLKKNRIYFSVQVIAACYTLSALSKLYTSGINWFAEGKNMTLQILKSNQVWLLDHAGSTRLSADFSSKMEFVLDNGFLFSLFLVMALMIELFSAVSLVNKKIRLYYGFILLFMHLGIAFFMNIIIMPFCFSMIVFMINPLYLIFQATSKLTKPKKVS